MNTYFRTGVVTLLLGFSLTACHEAKKSDTSAESTVCLPRVVGDFL